jgi:hypothetical protein
LAETEDTDQVTEAAVSGSDEETDETDTDTAEEADDAEAGEEEALKDVYAVGEAVQLGDNVLTVTEVVKSSGDEFDSPKSGHEYVIVHVTIDNAGDENISYNAFNFKMANSQGQIVDQAFTIVDSDTSLGSGELAPGGTVSGTISFEQPADDPELQLQFEPGFWSGDMVKVDLQ